VFCTEAGEQRSRLQAAAAVDSRTAAEQHQAETTELRRQLTGARDDVTLLQQQLSDAGDRQAALVVEIRRMLQQLSSAQMELEASRAIASTQRETILVREAELARLEARLGLVQRSLQSGGHAGDCSGIKQPPLPGGTTADTDALKMSVMSCSTLPGEVALVGVGRCDVVGSTADETVLPAGDAVADSHVVPENPDSLLAMWHQLQLSDPVYQSDKPSAISNPRTSTNPPGTTSAGTTSARLGSALEEKARVQSRIKALIGYQEPAKKTSTTASAKPRMSVRPQPLNHTRSSAAVSASMKQLQHPMRQTSANDTVANVSQTLSSSAVSHYTTSSADHLSINWSFTAPIVDAVLLILVVLDLGLTLV